jgi:hypothetical protein
MTNETITTEQLNELRNKLGRHSHTLNERYTAGSRTAIEGNVRLNLMEVAALEVALDQLLRGMQP